VAVAPPPAGPLPDGLVTKRPPVDQHAIDVAVGVGAAALALVGLVLVVRMVVPMGRRRGWRPGRQV
jgi:hypothetical protein